MMGRDLGELTYDEWLDYVFHHSVTDPAWYHGFDLDWWDEERDPAVTVDYMTRLFQEAGSLRGQYTDEQLSQGLYFLVSNSSSDHMFALKDARVPIDARVRCIEAIYDMYRDLFAPACGNELGAGSSRKEHPLSEVCFMWWDLVPIYRESGAPEALELYGAILRTMQRTLGLESEACCEGALHGLGHWAIYYPAFVKAVITKWLVARPGISRRLREYAVLASRGSVL